MVDTIGQISLLALVPIVPTKTAHALTRLILFLNKEVRTLSLALPITYTHFVVVVTLYSCVGKGLTDISTMPTPKHVRFYTLLLYLSSLE